MSTNLSIEQLQSATVIDQDGDKIGDVGQVYVDDATGDPSWITVRTGLFGTKETFIPLDRAQSDADGVRVPYEKQFVKDAPNMNEDEHLSPEQEAELYRYYGLDAGSGDSGRETAGVAGGGEYTDVDRGTSGVDTDVAGTNAGYSADLRDPDTDVASGTAAATGTGYTATDDVTTGTATTAGYDTAATAGTTGYDDTARTAGTGDEDIVRREERLKVGTETRESGRLRLRKHVVTENQTVTVPVTREEVTIEREPIADGEAHSGGRIGEDDEQTITLHEEVPVVDKEVVDAERIAVHRDTVNDQQTVSGEVRREEVDVDREGDAGTTGTTTRRDDDR